MNNVILKDWETNYTELYRQYNVKTFFCLTLFFFLDVVATFFFFRILREINLKQIDVIFFFFAVIILQYNWKKHWLHSRNQLKIVLVFFTKHQFLNSSFLCSLLFHKSFHNFFNIHLPRFFFFLCFCRLFS